MCQAQSGQLGYTSEQKKQRRQGKTDTINKQIIQCQRMINILGEKSQGGCRGRGNWEVAG